MASDSGTFHKAPAEDGWRDPKGLWRWMRFWLAASVLAYFTAAAIEVLIWSLYEGLLAVTTPQAELIDLVRPYARQVTIVCFIASAFLTLRMTARLMRNMHARGHDLTNPILAASYYFIPFVNLIMPPFAVGEIWRATFAASDKPSRGSAVIGWWWAAWLIGGFVASFSIFAATGRFGSFNNPTPADLPDEVIKVVVAATAVSATLRACAAALMLVVFGTLVRGQTMQGAAEAFD